MMKVSEKLKAIADLVSQIESDIVYYNERTQDVEIDESLRECYAYRVELCKAMKDALLSKVSKL